MTEDEARELVRSIVTPRQFERLTCLAALINEENERQNLIGRSTIPHMWARHVLDSVQLLRMAQPEWGTWLDVGTGGGFPGLAIACATDQWVTLVEPRSLRVEFLQKAISVLGVPNVAVEHGRVERLVQKADVISARAVAGPQRLLQQSQKCATSTTRWIFPVGRWSEQQTQMVVAAYPNMLFHVEQSLSDPTSSVLVGKGVPT